MLIILAILMILIFIYSLSKKKAGVFSALAVIPFIFGILVCIIQRIPIQKAFEWVQSGTFYSVNSTTGKVAIGVISPAVLILFAVLFFSIMLNAGMFDPLCIFFIKKAKGDPLKITMSTALVATVVTMNGDTTTTILIVTAAFLTLYQQMNIKMIYLAVILIIPVGIFNQLPWGGPSLACATALSVDIGTLFTKLLPGLLVAEAYAIFAAYIIGKKERKRLNFDPVKAKTLTPEQMQKMISSITDLDPELKRPKMFIPNLALTAVILTLLITDQAPGPMLFMVGSAFALIMNYPNVEEAEARLAALAPDVLPSAIATLAAGVFSGVLSGSGMANALAGGIASIIPASLGVHMTPIYAALTSLGTVFLPQDAFYFGIASVIAHVMAQFGISAEQVAVASMVGQAFRVISPVVPPLYMLCERTKINFVDYQKEYCKYAWPILFIYLFMHTVTGAMPF